ncbi:MAG TPA: GNAT family N-acetyltransferase [Terriglobales bacterium]|nr:GNAT family N-acetyltransferase [Terriglobales bacterium]
MSSETVLVEPICKEDRLWSGLQFTVTGEEEFARQQEAAGDRVHLHDGVWWRELRSGFCQPCFCFREVDHRQARPQFLRSAAGYMHVAAPGSPANGTYRLIVREGMQEYSVRQLERRKRNVVRSAIARLQVRPVTRLEDLTGDGYEVYVSWRERTGWGNDKSQRSIYEAWITSAFLRSKRLVLGAYCDDKLVGFMLPAAVRNVAFISYIASHSDALWAYPNDALYHAFLCVARQTPGIEIANMGTVSTKASLDRFKLCYGTVKELPCYSWLNPAVRAFFGRRMAERYPWLAPAA